MLGYLVVVLCPLTRRIRYAKSYGQSFGSVVGSGEATVFATRGEAQRAALAFGTAWRPSIQGIYAGFPRKRKKRA